MRIFFVRHGLAEARETWQEDDFSRPLTKQGKKQMEASAKRLADLGLRPGVIITSPLTRARQTAEIVAEGLGLDDKLIADDRLSPGFNSERLASIFEDYPGMDSIMLVGHEPDFSETISGLIGGGSLVCKKGSLARVDLVGESLLGGELVWLIPPKALVL